METADVLGSSTAPLTWHDFLERMRQPSAADFVKAIKSFIVSFLNNSPDPERDSAAVQEFLGNMEAAFRAHPLWAGCSEEELESAGEGLEKYVMTKLFTRVFASLPDDVKIDDELNEKMSLIQQFIRPENLDIRDIFQNEASWLLAQKELQKINMYKAPRDKLVCILNCCKVINNLLLNASSDDNPPGADDFLPVLIYITMKANPPQLHSNLLYIQRYRRQTRLVAETAYYFTNILSVESFILNIDAKALSMDETEYEQNMEFARAVLPTSREVDKVSSSSSTTQENQIPKNDSFETKQIIDSSRKRTGSLGSLVQAFFPSEPETKSKINESQTQVKAKDEELLNKVPSILDIENKGANMLINEEKANMNRLFQDFPFFYSQAGDLRIGDVEDLVNEYKRIVLKYVCLSKGLGIETQSLSQPLGQNQDSSETVEESDIEEVTKSITEESESKMEDGVVEV